MGAVRGRTKELKLEMMVLLTELPYNLDSPVTNFILALTRGWTFLGRTLVRLVTKQRRSNENDTSTAARARFWAELREGQREAAAQASKPDP